MGNSEKTYSSLEKKKNRLLDDDKSLYCKITSCHLNPIPTYYAERQHQSFWLKSTKPLIYAT